MMEAAALAGTWTEPGHSSARLAAGPGVNVALEATPQLRLSHM